MKNSKKNLNQPPPPAPGAGSGVADDQATTPGDRRAGPSGDDVVFQPAGVGESAGAGTGSGHHDRNQKVLLGLALAILLLLITGSAFALGYYMGKQDAGISTLVNDRREGQFPGGPPGGRQGEPGRRNPEAPGEKEAPGEQPIKEQLQQELQDENTELIKGEVTLVDGPAVTVQAPHGSEALTITEETRFIGGGPASGAGGDVASTLVPGARATLLVRKADDGKLEVLAVRVKGQAPLD